MKDSEAFCKYWEGRIDKDVIVLNPMKFGKRLFLAGADYKAKQFKKEHGDMTTDTSNGMGVARVHELKTDPESYNDIEGNNKTNTVRLNDRAYQEGDYIILRKTKYTGDAMKSDPPAKMPLVYLGVALMCKITHVYEGDGVSEGYVVLSLDIIDRFPGRVK